MDKRKREGSNKEKPPQEKGAGGIEKDGRESNRKILAGDWVGKLRVLGGTLRGS